MDKSGANKAAMDEINKGRELPIEIRQNKYLNNIIEQDHRAVKRIKKPMMGFKSFPAARKVLAGIELMHMSRKGQMIVTERENLSSANQFYSLAA
jgi:transposase-like protein